MKLFYSLLSIFVPFLPSIHAKSSGYLLFPLSLLAFNILVSVKFSNPSHLIFVSQKYQMTLSYCNYKCSFSSYPLKNCLLDHMFSLSYSQYSLLTPHASFSSVSRLPSIHCGIRRLILHIPALLSFQRFLLFFNTLLGVWKASFATQKHLQISVSYFPSIFLISSTQAW